MESNNYKLKVLLEQLGKDISEDINPEDDAFELGLLSMHGLIDEDLNLTAEGEKRYNEIVNGVDE